MYMQLGSLARARASLTRAVARPLLGADSIRNVLLGARYRKLVAQGLDPHIATVLAIEKLTKHSEIWTMTPEEARIALAEGVRISEDPPEADVETRDTFLRADGTTIPARTYAPRGLSAPSPGLLYIHGGGWVTGDIDTHDTLCRRIAVDARIRVVSISYRLAPEHRFPAAADDAVLAFRALVRRAGELGIDTSRIAVGGDSAGGNLSAVVGLETRKDDVRPALQLLLYPALDATCELPSHAANSQDYYLTERSIGWYMNHYFRSDASVKKNPRLSPLWEADVTGAPPALVYAAEFDPLRDEALAYAERLREVNIPADVHYCKGLIHGFALMTGLSPAAMKTTREMAKTLGDALRK